MLPAKISGKQPLRQQQSQQQWQKSSRWGSTNLMQVIARQFCCGHIG